jgi:hypothetical protein
MGSEVQSLMINRKSELKKAMFICGSFSGLSGLGYWGKKW